MPETKPYDDIEKLVSPESIQIMTDAVKEMQKSVELLGKAINEALENPENPHHDHEIIKSLIVAEMNEK